MTTNTFDPNNPCIFCNPKKEQILAENNFAILKTDGYPVSDGHCVIIPKRHIKTQFELTAEENTAVHELLKQAKNIIEDKGLKPDGYNVGSNNNTAAGQSVFHLHIHIIPRYLGDVENPKGGVRQVLPKTAAYNMGDRKA